MKYRVEIAGRAYEVEAISSRHVRIDGEDMFLDVSAGHVLHEGRSMRFHLRRDARGNPCAVHLQGHDIELTVEDPTARRTARARTGRAAAASSGQVVAPMNGQVVNVLHKAGDEVAKGDVVLVLEAMKMENEVVAPVGGVVTGVLVAKGATVKSGDALFTVEPAAPNAAGAPPPSP